MTLYLHGNGYYHYDNGKRGAARVYFSTGERNKRTAFAVMRDRLANGSLPCAVQSGAQLPPPPPPSVPASAHIKLGEAAAGYLDSAAKAIGSVDNYRAKERYVGFLISELGADRDIFSITENDLEPLCEALENRGLSGTTVNQYVLKTLRPIFNWVWVWRDRERSCKIWWKAIQRDEDDDRVRYLFKDEMRRFLAVLTREEGLLHQFAWITGLRAMEMINLRWEEIDWDNHLITTTVKGPKIHTLPLTRKLESMLRELETDKHPTHVFSFVAEASIHAKGYEKGERRPYSYDVLTRRMRTALEAADITDYTFHDHRHTAATLLFLATGKIRLVQMLLGHSLAKTTERYMHLDVRQLGRELERMDAQDLPYSGFNDSFATAGSEAPTNQLQDLLKQQIEMLNRLVAGRPDQDDRSAAA